jgi:mevalonate kinase
MSRGELYIYIYIQFFFCRKKNLNFVNRFTHFQLLITDTRISKNTKKQVELVKERYLEFPEIIQPLLTAIGNISKDCMSLFQDTADTKDNTYVYEKLEKLIDINHALLIALGVSHPQLEKIRSITLKFGLISKLSGAGGGGCTLTFIPPKTCSDVLSNVKKELEDNGFHCFIADVGCEGVQVCV